MKVENLHGEIWKDIFDYEGLYQVSNLGRIKALDRFTASKSGKTYPFDEMIKIPQIDKFGYHRISLRKNSTPRYWPVHRLVLSAFVDNVYQKEQVNHIDGNKGNNKLENLEWVTRSENKKHSYDVLGEKPRRGLANGMTKIGPEGRIKIRELFNSGMSAKNIAIIYNVTPMTIWRITTNRVAEL